MPGVVRASVSPYWTERGADGFGRFTRVFDRAPERVLACYLMSVTLDGEVPESDETWLWYEFEGTGLRFPITREMLGKTMCVRPLALQGRVWPSSRGEEPGTGLRGDNGVTRGSLEWRGSLDEEEQGRCPDT